MQRFSSYFCAMILDRISILNYKNLCEVNVSFSQKLNCFVGLNGMGKTNLLDAIYFLSFCKSATNAIDSQNIRHDAGFFMIQGFYHTADGTREEEVYCGMKPGRKKQFKRNRKEYQRLSDHIGLIPLVMVSPDDAVLLQGGSAERRRFMDVVISQYDKDYLERLIRYNKALAQRNAMLKDEERADDGMMDIMEEMMAAEGEVIHARRKAFVEEFIPIFRDFYSYISDGSETVDIEYLSHCTRGPLLDVIRDGRSKDRIMGFSLHGIHKDELQMSIGSYAMKREASQGQNKTFLIALKLAQLEFLKRMGDMPILLLDDIFDRLDARRVEKIVRLAGSDRFGQIFITDTNRSNLDMILQAADVDYRLFSVTDGIVEPMNTGEDGHAQP